MSSLISQVASNGYPQVLVEPMGLHNGGGVHHIGTDGDLRATHRVTRRSHHSALVESWLEAQSVSLSKEGLNGYLKARTRYGQLDNVVREDEVLEQLPAMTPTSCISLQRAVWRVRLKRVGDSGSPCATLESSSPRPQ